MNILFLHNNFPAQYRHVARRLAADKANRVVFISQRVPGKIPGVTNILSKPHREVKAETHHYLRPTEAAVVNAQAVFRNCLELKKKGFEPDIVCAHSGWGNSLYVKEVFPNARLLSYFEWFYHARGTDADFLDPGAMGYDDAARIHSKNMPLLMDLATCDWGQVPTRFQLAQIPPVFHARLSVLHDGVDTDFFKPDRRVQKKIGNLDLGEAREILTFATRGMEPYRGFPEFMRAAALLMDRRPDLHVLVVGEDRVAYGKRLPEGEGWGQRMVAELKPDPARLHFTGPLAYGDYVKVLQFSTVRAYLTVPFVLSWSLIESLACGGLVVGSDTAPVREVIRHGENGFLAPFDDVEAFAAQIEEVLDTADDMQDIRAAARKTAVEKYALEKLLPRQLRLIEDVAAGRLPPRERSAN
ncbi:glycosyltransferase [Sneathiella chungangensis]|uniref:Glycosyltransferase n=1 Tax=Sneathiella chungangensis TaxID=1418234 RepID=A0A845MKE0_9PROT|nr:glycosyltransferase [Sneathiella chungangensis]MZR24042.1 glycosyltransferase [Sneathiella chungangensis]